MGVVVEFVKLSPPSADSETVRNKDASRPAGLDQPMDQTLEHSSTIKST